MSAADMACPHCRASMQGEEISAEHRVHKEDCAKQVARYGRCYCFPYGEATHFSRVMGHEISGIYDGVLYWSCPDCGKAWQRFADGERLSARSAEYVAIHNGAVARGGAA